MALYIRNEKTCRLARELAALRGVTITEAIHFAVKERLEQLLSESQPGLAVKQHMTVATAAPPSQIELRRLLHLCTGARKARAGALEGRGVWAYGFATGSAAAVTSLLPAGIFPVDRAMMPGYSSVF